MRDENAQKKLAKRRFHRRWGIDAGLYIILALAVVSVAVTWWQHGQAGMQEALHRDWELTWLILPLLAAAMLLAGLLQVLLPRERVAGWLGAQSGMRGLLMATLAGTVTPGGPMTSFPVALAIGGSGADIGAVVAYITAWSVLGVNRLIIWEMPFMGQDFALMRECISLPIPILTGLLARWWFAGYVVEGRGER